MGLLLNSLLGWRRADPIAALVVAVVAAVVAVKVGGAAWRGDACCAAEPLTGGSAPTAAHCCDGEC